MTVKQYQKVNEVSNAIYLDSVDKVAFTICHLLGYTEEQVDNFTPANFNKLMGKTIKMIGKTAHPLWYSSKLNTDASKITLGQFIEVSHWAKSGIIESMHLIAATMIHDEDHAATASRLLKTNVRHVLPYVSKFIESFEDLIKSYPGLFPPAPRPKEGEELVKPEPVHPFIERYGWIYSATQIAELENIKLDEAYDLPIMQALNDLAYLKSKGEYDKKMNK